MKNRQAVSATVAILALGLIPGVDLPAHAQTTAQIAQTRWMGTSLAELQPLDPETVPPVGTFYLLNDYLQTGDAPPYPFCPPLSSEACVYSLSTSDGVFLVDDPAAGLQGAESRASSSTTLNCELDFPEEGEESGGTNEPPAGFTYSTNDLWLQILEVTNGSVWFLVHSPETNGVYDLFSTTNLGLTEPGPTVTAWLPVLRCEPGQTNLLVAGSTANECFFILGITNDTDADGLTDAFEKLVSHTDPDNSDQNTNNIPDGWEWDYFGGLDQSAQDDYDGDGVLDAEEYLQGSDPNKIRFSVVTTNQYVNGSTALMQLNIAGGVPSSVAMLLNDTGFSNVVWQAYSSSNLVVSLGSSNGDYQVWIGLRGRLERSYQTWHGATLTLDTVPPVIVVTNPAVILVSRPVIQLQGYVSEPLASLTYDLTNAAGLATNLEAFITGQHPDTNTWRFTTSDFQAYDVVLTNGENTITLRASDLAGNLATTNLTLTLDASSATNPPEVTILWPPSDIGIAGTNTVLRGWVDDDTASVTVSVGSNTCAAMVERGGSFSVPDLPLLESTNAMTITATNAAGFGAAMTAFVIATQHVFSMDAFVPETIVRGLATVTGRIVESGLDLWVNGIQAAINADGSWEADDVPLRDEAGTGQFYVAAYKAGSLPIGLPVAAQLFPVTLPPLVQASGYLRYYWWSSSGSCGETPFGNVLNQEWELGAGGESILLERDPMQGHTTTIEEWPADRLPVSTWESRSFFDGATQLYYADECTYMGGYYWARFYEGDNIQTLLQLTAGGPAQKRVQHLIRLVVSVVDGDGLAVPPSLVNIFGQTLTPTTTNTDVGELYVTMPAGAARDLPVAVPNMKNYTIADARAEQVKLRILDAVNTTIDYTDKTNTVVVGQKISLLCQSSLTNATPTNFQWTIPGWTISNYVATANAGTVYSNYPTANSNVFFYWVDGGSNRQIECSVIVHGQVNVGKAIFSVSSPSPQFRADVVGNVAADTNYVNGGIFCRPVLHFGGSELPPVGIDLVYTNAATPPSGGKYFIAQVVLNSHIQRNQMVGTNIVGLELIRYGLDNYYPYQGTSSTGTHNSWQDSPGSLLEGATWLSRTDSFSAFLMFRPAPYDDSSIAVPMSVANWGWSGNARTNYSSSGYALINGAPTIPVVSAPTTFPQWTTNAASIVDYQTNSIPYNEN